MGEKLPKFDPPKGQQLIDAIGIVVVDLRSYLLYVKVNKGGDFLCLEGEVIHPLRVLAKFEYGGWIVILFAFDDT
jgi:hypothetical protein